MRRKDPRMPPREGPRVNESIRISQVRVILEDGTQLGVMPTRKAKYKAKDMGLDLVEVSPNARPPVCKIMDYGRYKYEQSKKKSQAKKKQTTVQLKQIKLRPKIGDHDLDFKIRDARKFLEAGNKVQIEVRFRGRENAHPEVGRALLDRMLKELADIAKIEQVPHHENRSLTVIVTPK